MIPSRSTASTETDNVSSIRMTPVAGQLSHVLALALSALAVSGCMTTSEHARAEGVTSSAVSAAARSIITPDAGSADKPVGLVRLQSPTADDAGAVAAPAPPAQPPLPDPSLSSSAPDTSLALATPPWVDPAADGPAADGLSCGSHG